MSRYLVSIRELKRRLNHYLQLIPGKSGVITDRGLPIGRIVPMGQDFDQRLAGMCETGQAQWSGRRLIHRKPVAKLRRPGSVAQLIVEDRD